MPKVSFITMSHNYGHYLGECLSSIFAQTCKDFDVHVINAGSSDNTSEIAKGFPVTLHEIDDAGLCSSRNHALFASDSDYIVNLDADDTIHPQFLEKLLAKAAPDKIVCPGLQEFGNGNNSGWPNAAWGPGWGLTYDHFKKANRIFCCSLFPREAARRIGYYDPALNWLGCEDWCLWTDLVCSGCTVEIVPELLFNYRKHSGSVTQSWTERFEKAKQYIGSKHP